MSLLTAPRQTSAASVVTEWVDTPADVEAPAGQRFEVSVRAEGDFALTRALIESVEAALAIPAASERPIVSANLARGTVDVIVGATAESRDDAEVLVGRALVRAMADAGAEGVVVRRTGFRGRVVATPLTPALLSV